eukprot:5824189-Pyramimonas_sp.AAC.1
MGHAPGPVERDWCSSTSPPMLFDPVMMVKVCYVAVADCPRRPCPGWAWSLPAVDRPAFRFLA